ncbi:MAG TPA: hypothetical protein VF331_01040 [Polyangiales bacterium]
MRSQPQSRFSPLVVASFTATFTAACIAALALGACGGSGVHLSAGPMPEGGTFTGVYHSPQYGDMNLIQNGSAVVGDYKQEMRAGKIQGEAEGDVLRFEWTESKAMIGNRPTEARGHGYFRYKIDKGNGDHVLTGEWGLGDAASGGGPWNAYKQKNKEPHLASEKRSSGGEKSSGDDESGSSGHEEKSDDDLF